MDIPLIWLKKSSIWQGHFWKPIGGHSAAPKHTQRRYAHRNDTWGRIVPVDVLVAEVAVKREALRQRESFRVPS